MKNPFKKADSGEPVDYFRERDALAAKYAPLLDLAGIADEIARCHELLDGWPDDNRAPFGTEVWRKAEERLDGQRFESYRNRLRRIVFGVLDVTLRCEIISCARQSRELRLKSFQRDLWNAQQRCNQTGKLGIGRTIGAAVAGAGLVILFWSSGGAMWGTAAGVFMVIGAIYDVAEQQRVARRAIDEIVRREVFTSYEQITGENGEELDKELGLPRDSERASS